MPDGTRSTSGCITCRIRKKKCDEVRPVCQACQTRQLTCYGYAEPAPLWYTNKSSWKEVRECPEARALRTLAETRYKIQRKVGTRNNPISGPSFVSQAMQDFPDFASFVPGFEDLTSFMTPYQPPPTIPNTWQLAPETIWWDSRMRSLAPSTLEASSDEIRLLMLYVDVIQPITHTFYPITSSQDRGWLLNRLTSNQPLYKAALSTSACFEYSLTQPPKVNEIGIHPSVRSLQSVAVRGLQTEIEAYVKAENLTVQDFVLQGVRLVDTIHGLLNLEIFSMLQGCWEMHYKASRALLSHIETHRPPALVRDLANINSPITAALIEWPMDEGQRRTLKFSLCNYIWMDVVGSAIFGHEPYGGCDFHYLPLLEANILDVESIFGCSNWIAIKIMEIVRLAESPEARDTGNPNRQEIIHTQAQDISAFMIERTQQLENEGSGKQAVNVEHDIRLISTLFAYAAQVLLQVLILEPTSVVIDQHFVNIILDKLEELPTRLVIRSTWPYAVAGCMATEESQFTRFRGILGRAMEDSQAPGISWKGLLVMEECWRLRNLHPDQRIGWGDAMESMNARVLLL